MPPSFAMVPLEVCADPRLTKMQIRVLIALLSFRSKNTDTVWPKRQTLAERCGYSAGTVSKVTAQLVDLGWLKKDGNGGRSKANHYRVTVPDLDKVLERETLSDSDTLSGQETLSKVETVPGLETVPGSATKTLSGLDKGIEQTNEQTNKYLGDFDFSTWPEVPGEQVWKDFKQHRSKRKAVITQTVINQLGKQFTLAYQDGRSVDECLATMQESGWTGFQYSWVLNREGRNGGINSGSGTKQNQSRSDRADQALRDHLSQH